MESSSFSGSLKKAKTHGNIAQVAHCLVDGCNADLSLCRAYHRRHKVCEIHSKTPEVIIGGREQRFCQQCSRFHSLVEFDKGKRSCRKRLDGHNRRRRKPQPESLSRNSGLVFSNQQGTRLLSFSSPQILPSSVANSSWTGIHVKPQNSMVPCNNQQRLNYNERKNSIPECSTHNSYQGMNQLQLIQGGDRAIQETSTCQPFLEPKFAMSGSTKIISDRLNQVVDSYCALSLLSSAPTPTPTVSREFGLNHMVETEGPIPQTQSVVHNWLCNNGLGHYSSTQESKPVVSVTDSYGSNASNTVYFQEVFQQVPEGSSTNGSNQTLTFMWE